MAGGLTLAGSLPSLGQTEFVLAGKYKAHPTKLLARMKSGQALQSAAASLQSIGVAVGRQSQLVPGLVVLEEAPAGGGVQKMGVGGTQAGATLGERVRALQETGLFEYVQPCYYYTNVLLPTDAKFVDNTLWGLRNTGAFGGVRGADISAVQAWDLTTGSTNVIVAVVDTGIRYTHRELVTQMWHNPGEKAGNRTDDDSDGVIDDVFGYNAVTRSGDPFDDNDHGTHVAGTIGAAANDGLPLVGVAWKVQLMACKFLAADGFGASDDAIAAIEYAVNHGARVINASWGGGPFERALYDTLAAARRRGVLFVAAAGNDLSDNDHNAFYPASHKLDNIIAVAAIDRSDRLAWFSNFGQSSVHLAAPGDEIYSSIAASDSSYDTFSGTSMATPHVAGVAALILSLYPNATVSELRERLLSTVARTPTLEGRVRTGGRVNAYAALSAKPDGTIELAFDPPEGSDLSARRPVPFYVTVTDLAGLTNAVVHAQVQGSETNVTFLNDGSGVDFQARDEVYSAELTLPKNPGPFTIEFSVSAPGKASVTRSATFNIAAPPLNDNFADALDLPVEGGLIQWTNRFATIEPGEPQHARSPSASASVWWNWTPSAGGPVIVDTAGSAFDTVVAVYTNNVLRSSREVASGDDAGSKKQGYATFTAVAGLTYHIAVAGFTATDAGMIRLRVEPNGTQDLVPPVVTLTEPAPGLVVTNASEPKVLVAGTAADSMPNSSGIRQVQIQVNREIASTAEGTTNWSKTVVLKEGQNRIKVTATDYAGNSSPLRTVVVTMDPQISPNDFLANAFELTGTEGSVTGNNTRAGKESGEPLHAGKTGGKSIWWKFQPSSDGVLSLSTANSTFDTLLALYSQSGAGLQSLQALAANDNAAADGNFSKVSQALRGGQTYFVAVDGAGGASGVVQLAYEFRPALVYSLTVEAGEGGAVSPTAGLFEANSTVSLLAAPDQFYQFDSWTGGFVSSANPAVVTMTGDLHVVGLFKTLDFTDGFETGDLERLSWRTSGNSPWIVEQDTVEAGKFAARSGVIGKGQKSSLLLTLPLKEGTGAFGLKVSSEPTWDTFEFYLNGRRLNRWSGELGWTNFQFAVTAGTNTLEWRYSKDFLDTAGGLDAAFIDNLDLPLAVIADGSTPAHLEINWSPGTAMQILLLGQTNQTYVLQSSADVNHWLPIATNVANQGAIRWSDLPPQLSATNVFFRAVSP